MGFAPFGEVEGDGMAVVRMCTHKAVVRIGYTFKHMHGVCKGYVWGTLGVVRICCHGVAPFALRAQKSHRACSSDSGGSKVRSSRV